MKGVSGYGSNNAGSNNFLIGALGGSNAYKVMAKFSACVVNENDSKIMELVPAMRDSDSEVGMYDIVGNTFLTNAGSGTFNYGTL